MYRCSLSLKHVSVSIPFCDVASFVCISDDLQYKAYNTQKILVSKFEHTILATYLNSQS